jgi:SAM-dependent MidA family methyltransferase
MLVAFDRLGFLPEVYYILEPSASLQQRQQERLRAALPIDLFARVQWLTWLPAEFVGVIVGNEVVDALPVEVLRLLPDANEQAFVRWDEHQGRFDWQWHPIIEPGMQAWAGQIRRQVGEIDQRGYVTECRPVLTAWVHSLAESIRQGALLLIDYGYSRREYYAPTRWMGSLRAHYQHRAHQDVFWYPGLQDLTAHVDFTALAEAGSSAGLVLSGYTTQAHFLLSLGIVEAVDPSADVMTHLKMAQQIKTLTMPDEMGENFKVMMFLKGVEGRLTGFSLRDLREQL